MARVAALCYLKCYYSIMMAETAISKLRVWLPHYKDGCEVTVGEVFKSLPTRDGQVHCM